MRSRGPRGRASMVGALLCVMRAWPMEARPIALVAQAHSWVRGAHVFAMPADRVCTPRHAVAVRHNAMGWRVDRLVVAHNTIAIVLNRSGSHVFKVKGYGNRLEVPAHTVVMVASRRCRLGIGPGHRDGDGDREARWEIRW